MAKEGTEGKPKRAKTPKKKQEASASAAPAAAATPAVAVSQASVGRSASLLAGFGIRNAVSEAANDPNALKKIQDDDTRSTRSALKKLQGFDPAQIQSLQTQRKKLGQLDYGLLAMISDKRKIKWTLNAVAAILFFIGWGLNFDVVSTSFFENSSRQKDIASKILLIASFLSVMFDNLFRIFNTDRDEQSRDQVRRLYTRYQQIVDNPTKVQGSLSTTIIELNYLFEEVTSVIDLSTRYMSKGSDDYTLALAAAMKIQVCEEVVVAATPGAESDDDSDSGEEAV